MKKYGKRLNLDKLTADISDTDPNSKYFGVTETSAIFSSGKNSLSINGSTLLKDKSEIFVEILDYNNNPLYVEVGRTFGKAVYRDGVSLVFSAHVYSDTPKGKGIIYIVGTSKEGRSVKWEKPIEINPSLQNTSKVRFYNKPEFGITPFINITSQYSTSSTAGITSTGEFFGTPIKPSINSNIEYFDKIRNETIYQINWTSGTKFSSSMEGGYIDFGTGDNAKIKKVKNDTTIFIDKPFVNNNIVVSTSSTFSINHNPYREYVGNTEKRIGTAELIFKNIETFTGNVYRYKIYRSSLNAPYDAELVSDGTFFGNEMLSDTESPRRATSKVGFFYSQDQINNYWTKSTSSITLTHSPDLIIDSMKISGLQSDENPTKSKNVLCSIGSNKYIPYSESDFESYDSRTAVSSSYRTNFVRLYKDVDYEISMDLICEKNQDIDSKIQFYLTSSMTSILKNKSYDGFGLKIAEYTYTANENYPNKKKFFGTVKTIFNVKEDLNGTIVIVPSYGDYTISSISIKPYTDFSLNPQTFTIRIPFDAKTENEGFEVTCELFDINQNSVYRDLKTINFFDPSGETYPYNYFSNQRLTLTDGTNSWRIEMSSGDLKISRLAGSGILDVGDGVGVKLLGKTVSTGAVDSGGTGYRVLRVPN